MALNLTNRNTLFGACRFSLDAEGVTPTFLSQSGIFGNAAIGVVAPGHFRLTMDNEFLIEPDDCPDCQVAGSATAKSAQFGSIQSGIVDVTVTDADGNAVSSACEVGIVVTRQNNG